MPNTLDRSAYLLSFRTAERALVAEQAYYRSIADDYTLSPAERAQAIAVGSQIESKLALLRAQLDLYLAMYGSEGVPEPSQEMLKESVELAKGLAKELKEATTAVAVLSAIAGFMDVWKKLLTPAPAPT